MPYDRHAYFEQRQERRNERLAEESYQRNLARAKTGEMAAAHAEGQEAIGQGPEAQYQKSLDRARSGEMAAANQQGLVAQGLAEPKSPKPTGSGDLTPPPPLASDGERPEQSDVAGPPAAEQEPSPITYDDEPRPMARGGRYRDGEQLLVGEAGYPEIIDTRRKTVTPAPGFRAAPGFRNTGAIRERNLRFSRDNLTAPEAQVIGHQIDERKQAGTNLAHVLAADVTGKRHVEAADVTGKAHVEGAKASAEPNLIQANVIKTKADREYMAQFNSERDAEYHKILSSVDQNWPSTVAKLEQKYREQNGSDMPPEMRATILNSDQKTKIAYNRDMGTPDHGALLAMGLPKEGEAATRPGVLIAHGYEPQKDGSWAKTNVNPLSGTKYLDKFVPGAEGLTRKEEMIRAERTQGPGLYREEGRWYGSRTSNPQQVPPKVLTIEQALNPKVIESYNQRADKFNMPKIGADLIQQNPAAAAWQVLTGVNQMNTSIGKGNPYDMRHLNAPTYVLNDADTKKAVEGHASWLNPSTAPPTAPAGTPPATTPDFISAAREGTAAGAPGVAAVGPAPVASVAPAPEAAPAAAPTPAPAVAPGEVSEDPAVENWKAIGRNLMAAGKVTADTLAKVGGAVDLADRGAQNLVGLATRAATQTIPGAYKVFTPPTAENPMGLRPGEPEAPPAPATPTLAAAAPRFDERAGWGNSPQYPQREAPGPVPGVVTNRSVDAGVELPPEQAPRSLANVSPPQRFDERIGWSRPAPTPEVLPAPAAPAAPAPRFDERVGWAVPERKLELIRPSAM
jgi:hypothetical protein